MDLFRVAPFIVRGNKHIYHSSLLFYCANLINFDRLHLLTLSFHEDAPRRGSYSDSNLGREVMRFLPSNCGQ